MLRFGLFVDAFLLVVALGSPVAGANDDRMIVYPSSDWTIDRKEDACVLRRTFEAGGSTAVLEIEQQAPGPYFQVTLTAPWPMQQGLDPKVRFEPDRVEQVPQYARTRTIGAEYELRFTDSLQRNVRGNTRPYISWTSLQREKREREVTGLALADTFDKPAFFATGTMDEPMSALRTCIADLYSEWGVTLDKDGTPIEARLADDPWVLSQLIRRELPAVHGLDSGLPVIFRVVVEGDGTVRHCRASLTESAGDFGERGCAVIKKHARFVPPRDRRGSRVTAYSTIAPSLE